MSLSGKINTARRLKEKIDRKKEEKKENEKQYKKSINTITDDNGNSYKQYSAYKNTDFTTRFNESAWSSSIDNDYGEKQNKRIKNINTYIEEEKYDDAVSLNNKTLKQKYGVEYHSSFLIDLFNRGISQLKGDKSDNEKVTEILYDKIYNEENGIDKQLSLIDESINNGGWSPDELKNLEKQRTNLQDEKDYILNSIDLNTKNTQMHNRSIDDLGSIGNKMIDINNNDKIAKINTTLDSKIADIASSTIKEPYNIAKDVLNGANPFTEFLERQKGRNVDAAEMWSEVKKYSSNLKLGDALNYLDYTTDTLGELEKVGMETSLGYQDVQNKLGKQAIDIGNEVLLMFTPEVGRMRTLGRIVGDLNIFGAKYGGYENYRLEQKGDEIKTSQVIAAAVDLGMSAWLGSKEENLRQKIFGNADVTDATFKDIIEKGYKNILKDTTLKEAKVSFLTEGFEEFYQTFTDYYMEGNTDFSLSLLKEALISGGIGGALGGFGGGIGGYINAGVELDNKVKIGYSENALDLVTNLDIAEEINTADYNQVNEALLNGKSFVLVGGDTEQGDIVINNVSKNDATTFIVPSHEMETYTKMHYPGANVIVIDPKSQNYETDLNTFLNSEIAQHVAFGYSEHVNLNGKNTVDNINTKLSEINGKFSTEDNQIGLTLDVSDYADGTIETMRDNITNKIFSLVESGKISNDQALEMLSDINNTLDDNISNKQFSRGRISDLETGKAMYFEKTGKNTYVLHSEPYEGSSMPVHVYGKRILDGTTNIGFEKLENKSINLVNKLLKMSGSKDVISNKTTGVELAKVVNKNPTVAQQILKATGYDGVMTKGTDGNYDYTSAYSDLDSQNIKGTLDFITKKVEQSSEIKDKVDNYNREVDVIKAVTKDKTIELGNGEKISINDEGVKIVGSDGTDGGNGSFIIKTNKVLDLDTEDITLENEVAKSQTNNSFMSSNRDVNIASEIGKVYNDTSTNFEKRNALANILTEYVRNPNFESEYGLTNDTVEQMLIDNLGHETVQTIINMKDRGSKWNGLINSIASVTSEDMANLEINSYVEQSLNDIGLNTNTMTDEDMVTAYNTILFLGSDIINSTNIDFTKMDTFNDVDFVDTVLGQALDGSVNTLEEYMLSQNIMDIDSEINSDLICVYNKLMSEIYGNITQEGKTPQLYYDTVLKTMINNVNKKLNPGFVNDTTDLTNESVSDIFYLIGKISDKGAEKSQSKRVLSNETRQYAFENGYDTITYKDDNGKNHYVSVNGDNIVSVDAIPEIDTTEEVFEIEGEDLKLNVLDNSTEEVNDMKSDFENNLKRYQEVSKNNKSQMKTLSSMEKLKTWYSDKFAPIREVARKMGDLTIMKTIRKVHNFSNRISETNINSYQTDINGNKIKNSKGLSEIFSPLKNAKIKEDFNTYVMCMYNMEVYDKGTTKGNKHELRFTDLSYDYCKKTSAEIIARHPEFESIIDDLNTFKYNQNKIEDAAGFYDSKTKENLIDKKRDYRYYFPIYTEKLGNNYDNEIYNTFAKTHSTLKKGNQINSTDVAQDVQESFATRERIMRYQVAKNEAMKVVATSGYYAYNGKGRKGQLAYYDNGEMKYYETRAEISDCFDNQNGVSQELEDVIDNTFLGKTMRKIAQVKRASWTGSSEEHPILSMFLNISHGITNPVRDFSNSLYYKNHSTATFMKNYAKGVWAFAVGNQDYEDAVKVGLISDTRNQTKAKGVWQRLNQKASNFNQITEALPKISEFISYKNKGIDLETAAELSADTNLDFTVYGTIGGKISSISPLLNSSIQAQNKFINTFKNDAKGNAITGCFKTALRFLPYLSLGVIKDMFNDEEEQKTLDSLPYYIQHNYVCFPLSDGKVLKFPRGEMAMIWNTIDNIPKYISGDMENGFAIDLKQDVLETLIPNINIASILEIQNNIEKNEDRYGNKIYNENDNASYQFRDKLGYALSCYNSKIGGLIDKQIDSNYNNNPELKDWITLGGYDYFIYEQSDSQGFWKNYNKYKEGTYDTNDIDSLIKQHTYKTCVNEYYDVQDKINEERTKSNPDSDVLRTLYNQQIELYARFSDEDSVRYQYNTYSDGNMIITDNNGTYFYEAKTGKFWNLANKINAKKYRKYINKSTILK